MKVLQTIQGMSASAGGPSTCTRDLLEGLFAIGACVDLLTAAPASPEEHNLGVGRPWLKEIPQDYRGPLEFSRNMRKALESSEYDLYHCNALWRYTNHITCKTARRKGKPYVITPHGMLYPTALRMKAWMKKPMLALWFRRDIMQASCLHATCMQEAEYCRSFGYKGPIAVIPNPVVFPEGVEAASSKPAKKMIGFLGRLHPIKKVENLLQGAALAKERGCGAFSICVMGSGSAEYENFLRREAERLHLADRVEFVGFVGGMDKYARLARLRALMAPSEQENFGMIVPEALICGTPVYASLGTPWGELNDQGCGWWRDNSPETIAEVIAEIVSLPDEMILAMGARGRRLMEEKYEQSKVAGMMLALYAWLAGEGKKPDFVLEEQ